jgi:serine/threonine protein kinase
MTLPSSETESVLDAETTTETERTSSVTSRRLARILDDGLQFGKYRVIRLIAIGGMSEIYEAEHIALDKRVALKVMRRDLAENPTARKRFISEGINAARLRHTNVVDVTDVGEVDELPFLVMALLDGEDLGRIYERQGRIPIQDIVDLLLPVASAVAVGHEKGVVHRDLKPDNIFLHREGCRMIPKVLDFGVSCVMTARRITLNSSVFGTPHYMSPEQARGAPTDERTDQYSLGVILYEGVTGRLPRDSSNPIELLHSVAYDSFRPPSDYFEVPPGLEAVILRAMAGEPDDRFESMRELAVALLPFASEAAREYWSLELAAVSEPSTNTRLPQTARHPSPTPASLARLTQSSRHSVQTTRASLQTTRPSVQTVHASVHTTRPSAHTVRTSLRFDPRGGGEIVVARALPPPPPPPRPRVITPARIVAHAAALSEFEAALARHRTRRSRALLTGAALGVLIGVVVFGFWLWQRGPDPSAAAMAGRNDRVEYFDVEVQPTPPNANIELDGKLVASGNYASRLRRDGSEHELEVSAPGWTIASFTFRDAPPPKEVRLERAAAEPVAAFAPVTPAANSRPQPTTAKMASVPRHVTTAHSLPPTAASTSAAPANALNEPSETPKSTPKSTSLPRSTRPSVDTAASTTRVAIAGSATNSTPRVAITGDGSNGAPHVAVVEPARPRVRIVDEFQPKVRLVE